MKEVKLMKKQRKRQFYEVQFSKKLNKSGWVPSKGLHPFTGKLLDKK